MIKSRISQKIQVSRFEPLEYSVEIDSDDMPRENGEELRVYLARLHERLFKETLAFRVFHSNMTIAQAEAEILRFRKSYSLSSNGTKPED